jgi:hypothetical protein
MSKRYTGSRLALLLMVVAMLVGLSGLVASPVAAADNGTVISNGVGPNNRPSLGTSPDGTTICVVWSTFGDAPRTYARIFDFAQQLWKPGLNEAPHDVTKGSGSGTQGGSPRCTVDATGRTHVVWAEGGSKFIRYSMLAAGANPAVPSNWTDPITISSETDSQNPDVATLYADSLGRVWLAYVADDGGYTIFVRNWGPGSGWSGAQRVTGGNGHFPRIAVDNAGYVHVIFWQGGGGIRYSYRDPGTGQFISDVQLPGSGGAIQNTGLAVDRETGAVHAVYINYAGSGDNSRVVRYVKKSGSTGTNFSNPVDLTDQGNHVVPRLGFSQTGRLIMVTDKRDSNPSQIVYNVSNNNGTSWVGATGLTNSGVNAFDPGLTVSDNGAGYVAFWNKFGDTINFAVLFPAPPPPRCGSFQDVAETNAACDAILFLTQQGIINGYATRPPTFGPTDPVQRAQMAAFIVRALDWESRPQSPKTFSDFGDLMGELKTASLILANACDQDSCVISGYGDGRFGPTDRVTYAQVISFVSRAFVIDGRWTESSQSHPYQGVPAVHENDVRTFHSNADVIPGAPTTEGGWSQPAPRAWVALVLYQALAPR